MDVKVETVGMLEEGQADWGHQMDGVGSVVGVGTSGADRDGLDSQEAYIESLPMSLEAYCILRVPMRKSESLYLKVPVCYK